MSGEMLVNGCVVPQEIFKNMSGYVDQEDALMAMYGCYDYRGR